MDVWIRPEASNLNNFLAALKAFGFEELGLSKEDFLSGKIVQLGYPPVRIDIITALDGLESNEIRDSREAGKFGDQPVMYLGKKAFIKNKRAVGRHKDLADLEALGEKV